MFEEISIEEFIPTDYEEREIVTKELLEEEMTFVRNIMFSQVKSTDNGIAAKFLVRNANEKMVFLRLITNGNESSLSQRMKRDDYYELAKGNEKEIISHLVDILKLLTSETWSWQDFNNYARYWEAGYQSGTDDTNAKYMEINLKSEDFE